MCRSDCRIRMQTTMQTTRPAYFTAFDSRWIPKCFTTYEELLKIAMCVNGNSVPPRAKLLVMRSQSYGDKQREAQRRKKQEELWKKSNPESAPTSGTATNADKSDPPPNKTDTPVRRSA